MISWRKKKIGGRQQMTGSDSTEYRHERETMVVTQLENRGIYNQRVLNAMRKVPRHLFVEKALRDQAYADCPLPIGYDQTISQPYMVAEMTQILELLPHDRVLEIGTGSGYQTAVLAELASRVYSIERIHGLLTRTMKQIDRLAYDNIVTKCSDGTDGWLEQSPFDAIIVTAGSPRVPEPLKEQLNIGGRLVIPVGDGFSQILMKITRKEDGFIERSMMGCRFVKLIGRHGWEDKKT
jgi:protein-L-isoaspartate(D-aspartate) O-methyltransferase